MTVRTARAPQQGEEGGGGTVRGRTTRCVHGTATVQQRTTPSTPVCNEEEVKLLLHEVLYFSLYYFEVAQFHSMYCYHIVTEVQKCRTKKYKCCSMHYALQIT